MGLSGAISGPVALPECACRDGARDAPTCRFAPLGIRTGMVAALAGLRTPLQAVIAIDAVFLLQFPENTVFLLEP